ncbi:family 2 glycosyl transferase [Loktanella sp. 5RATIMAR09]|uniref:glycosyltransferase family 2 protein n=1 Tax=Loktanella sp. 5RATIMAR09 TaxID=1225655 RepID=UPI0006EB5E43|nr:glycosyltransferase family 2 protein [Loktanella sp. 5RATIMAR09]KQI71234.1 family 2 glycosyl transferase [Loktanella sp. 5RATIMAR09]
MKFTIITAVRNRSKTIGQAIDSVSKQGYADVEHVVVDGASTDGTIEVVDARHHYGMLVISEPDLGIYDALNKGIEAANGDVIGVMHSDDFYAHNDVLAKVEACFAETGADLVYGDLDYVSTANTDKIIRHWRSGDYNRKKLRRGWMPPHPALFVRRDVIERFGTYDTSFQIAADYDAMLRWLWTGSIHAAYVPEVLVKMRVGGESNRSIGRILRKSKEDYRALRSNDVGGLATLAWKNIRKIPQFVTKY